MNRLAVRQAVRIRPRYVNPNKQFPQRTGIIAIKKGMTSTWNADGTRIPITILALDGVQVTGSKTEERNGYVAVQIGSGWRDNPRKHLSRAMLGQFAAAKIPPKRHVEEFRVKDSQGLLPIGKIIDCTWFSPGQYVDIKARTIGKGFAGPMKRWGFKGLRASHGVSLAHRSLGSVSSGDARRVVPGRKMAGRMGGKQSTTQNVQVVQIIPDMNVVLVKGPVPGPDEGYVRVSDAIKKPLQSPTDI